MNGEAARGRLGQQLAGEPRGVGGGVLEGGCQLRALRAAVLLEGVINAFGYILGKGHGGQAVQGAFKRGGDGAAGDDETERAVETDIDAADDGVDLGGQEMGDGDADECGTR